MKRIEKKTLISRTAAAVSAILATCSADNKALDIGNSKTAITSTGEPGNVFGNILARAGFGGGRKVRGGDAAYCLKTVLGLDADESLPTNVYALLQEIEAVSTDSDSKRTYTRKAAKLATLTGKLAEAIQNTQIGRPVGRPRKNETQPTA